MKFFLPPLLVLTVTAGAIVWAQSSPSPAKASTQQPNAQLDTSLPTPSPSATAAIEPPSLIPANILPPPSALPKVPAMPELEQLNAFFKQTSLGKAADDYRLHLQTAELQTRIRNDQDLHALKAKAMQVPTDLERRHLLKAYYQLYYSKLRALTTAPDLIAYLNSQEAGYVASLLQPRVRHETDETATAALGPARAGASPPPALPTPVQARAGSRRRP